MNNICIHPNLVTVFVEFNIRHIGISLRMDCYSLATFSITLTAFKQVLTYTKSNMCTECKTVEY